MLVRPKLIGYGACDYAMSFNWTRGTSVLVALFTTFSDYSKNGIPHVAPMTLKKLFMVVFTSSIQGGGEEDNQLYRRKTHTNT